MLSCTDFVIVFLYGNAFLKKTVKGIKWGKQNGRCFAKFKRRGDSPYSTPPNLAPRVTLQLGFRNASPSWSQHKQASLLGQSASHPARKARVLHLLPILTSEPPFVQRPGVAQISISDFVSQVSHPNNKGYSSGLPLSTSPNLPTKILPLQHATKVLCPTALKTEPSELPFVQPEINVLPGPPPSQTSSTACVALHRDVQSRAPDSTAEQD